MSLQATKRDDGLLDEAGSGHEDQEASITVVCTSGAKRENFTLSLSTKLSDFRDILADDDHFGIPAKHQRIFCMGRELKSASRSLSNLGVGKFPHVVLHLHERPQAPAAASNNETNDSEEPARKRRRTDSGAQAARSNGSSGRQQDQNNNDSNNSSEVIDLVNSDAEEESEQRQVPHAANQAATATNDVVDLLDSDSEDENDSVFSSDDDFEEDNSDGVVDHSDQREVIEID